MSGPTIGSLCSGYGGLDMAIEGFFGATTAWFSEFEPAPSKVLEKHWPGVPNHGDMTKIDWSAVEPVDIIAGGTPCQDLSAAGKRKGMTEGTRSNLWVQMREAVAVIRPSLVIWENVRGAFSARATSEVESEPGLLGEFGPDRPALRALGRVLGDLSDLGYDTEWVGVRASDAGAPHGRFRVFVVAHTASARRTGREDAGTNRRDASSGSWCVESERVHRERSGVASDAASGGRDWRAQDALGETFGRVAVARSSGDTSADTSSRELAVEQVSESRSIRTAVAADDVHGTIATHADDAGFREQRRAVAIRPEHPAAECGGAVDADASCERFGEHAGESPAEETRPGSRDLADGVGGLRPDQDWGPYRPAIQRWERTLGRVAPSPTEPTGKGGAQRLSPAFVEWMMGLDPGWVTDAGLSRTDQLKALGNGVVPQQAALALSIMWPRITEAVAA